MTGITHIDGNVRVDFGKPVAWFAFPPELAIEFAMSIIRHAHAARDEKNAT
jgi:hypothetical protein